MKSLYESIISTTKSGRDSFDVKPRLIMNYGSSLYWHLDTQFEGWLDVVSEDNFCHLVEDPIKALKRVRSNQTYMQYSQDVGFEFNNGYFGIRFYKYGGKNPTINFVVYYSDKKLKTTEEKDVRRAQMERTAAYAKYKGLPSSSWNDILGSETWKDGAKKLLKWMRTYKNSFIK